MDANAFAPPPTQVSLLPKLLKANRMVLIRFIATIALSVRCAGKFTPNSFLWWLTQTGNPSFLLIATIECTVSPRLQSSLMVEARGQAVGDGGLEAPKNASEFQSICL